MSIPRGLLTLRIVQFLEETGIPSVYLRNYERLPEDVGNDVDLLIPRGRQAEATTHIVKTASLQGWALAGTAAFGELALYFVDPLTGDSLHIDLYEDFRWRMIDFADAAGVIQRRRWNGLVFVPHEKDELYLNIAERLIYQGKIREHHRASARAAIAAHGEDHVKSIFQAHLGKGGGQLVSSLIDSGWEPKSKHAKSIRRCALSQSLKHPLHFTGAGLSFSWRLAARFICPPGRFIVFEGADGVGKSTVMEAVIPWAERWCAGRTPQAFHWKPTKLRPWPLQAGPSVDPRGKSMRSPLVSLLFLAYHVWGFWNGWFFRIYPMLVKSHLVAGDRYSYDMFLDPVRFRLDLPLFICKLAALSVPRPDVVIGLVATPENVHARKPELEPEEIASYQARWESLAKNSPNLISVDADGPVDEVILKVKQAIISHYTGGNA